MKWARCPHCRTWLLNRRSLYWHLIHSHDYAPEGTVFTKDKKT